METTSIELQPPTASRKSSKKRLPTRHKKRPRRRRQGWPPQREQRGLWAAMLAVVLATFLFVLAHTLWLAAIVAGVIWFKGRK